MIRAERVQDTASCASCGGLHNPHVRLICGRVDPGKTEPFHAQVTTFCEPCAENAAITLGVLALPELFEGMPNDPS